jgi:acyl-CoA synthetase (AMP-forming)/AMP-acid ligase II
MSTLLDLIPKPRSFTSPTAIVLPASSSADLKPYGQRDPQNKVHHEQEEYSYSDLRALVLSFRKSLIEQLGVKQRDVVALSMTNTLEFVIAFLGTTVSRYAEYSLDVTLSA